MTNPNESTKFTQLELEAIISFAHYVAHYLNEQHCLFRGKHLWQTHSDKDSNRVSVNWRKTSLDLETAGNWPRPIRTRYGKTTSAQFSPSNLVYGYKYGHKTNSRNARYEYTDANTEVKRISWASIGNGANEKICCCTPSTWWSRPRQCVLSQPSQPGRRGALTFKIYRSCPHSTRNSDLYLHLVHHDL